MTPGELKVIILTLIGAGWDIPEIEDAVRGCCGGSHERTPTMATLPTLPGDQQPAHAHVAGKLAHALRGHAAAGGGRGEPAKRHDAGRFCGNLGSSFPLRDVPGQDAAAGAGIDNSRGGKRNGTTNEAGNLRAVRVAYKRGDESRQ